MYTIAGEAQFPQVRELWRQGFPADSEEDVAAFWRLTSGVGRCLLCWEGEQAVSMAFLLPAVGRVGTRRLPLWYVYAAVTHRDHRGRGLFRQLLQEAAAQAAHEGVAGLFLRPAEPSLFAYYEKNGFSRLLLAEEIEWKVEELYMFGGADDLLDAGGEYAERRREWLVCGGVSHVEWPQAVIDYAVQMAEMSGGGAVFCSFGAALCERDGDRLLVRELLCRPEERRRLAAALARRFPCREVLVNTPPMTGEAGAAFGMLRPCWEDLLQETLYMGLALE